MATIQEFTAKAQRGDKIAQCDLGVCYAEGRGVPRSNQQAVYWFQKSAAQNYAPAQYFMGIAYKKNIVIVPFTHQTELCGLMVDCFDKSARQGYAPAQYELALCYQDGKGKFHFNSQMQNIKQYLLWMTKSAEQNYSPAQFQLGETYYTGVEGVPSDMDKCKYWLKKGAANGNDKAQYLLGYIYYVEDRRYADFDEMIALEKQTKSLWKKAAAQGNQQAKQDLWDFFHE